MKTLFDSFNLFTRGQYYHYCIVKLSFALRLEVDGLLDLLAPYLMSGGVFLGIELMYGMTK